MGFLKISRKELFTSLKLKQEEGFIYHFSIWNCNRVIIIGETSLHSKVCELHAQLKKKKKEIQGLGVNKQNSGNQAKIK